MGAAKAQSTDTEDRSHGYDGVCSEFVALREARRVGASTIADWAKQFPPGASVIDLGCGHGVPISEVLIDSGCDVHAVDASPRMTAAFRQRFPEVTLACEAVEDSGFFGRTYDGVVAWGLMFLLPNAEQERVISKVAKALNRGGRFVFTAPDEPAEWSDILTGHRSRSLGAESYRRLLASCGFRWTGEGTDEGANHYYYASR